MKQKNIGSYLSAVAAVCTLLTLIFCIVTGTAQGDLSAGIVVLLIFGIFVEGVTFVKDFFGIGTILGSVFTGAGIMVLVVARLNKIGLILNGVVEEAIPAAFIAAVVFALLAIVLNCVVGFIGTQKQS